MQASIQALPKFSFRSAIVNPLTAPQEPDWASARGFGRHASVTRTMRRNWQLNPGPSCIVETGTLRNTAQEFLHGDGWATLAWGWYASKVGGRAFTVDIDPCAMAVCRRATAEFARAIEYVTSDSIKFLQNWDSEQRGQIHLLYLDSVDYVDTERSEAHHLAEAQAALPSLADKCLVLFDDTVVVDQNPPHAKCHDGETGRRGDGEKNAEQPPVRPNTQNPIPSTFLGKGARAIPYLIEQGFEIEWAFDGQVLLSRGAEGIPELPIDGELTRKYRRGLIEESIAEEAALPPLVVAGQDCERFANGNANHEFMEAVLNCAGSQGSVCEVGTVAGYGPILLSQRGLRSYGFAFDPCVCEHACQTNNRLGGGASFSVADPLEFDAQAGGRYSVVYHWDLLSTLPSIWIRSVLAQHVIAAEYVVCSVSSVFSNQEFTRTGSGRFLLPLDEWRKILEDFDVAELRYIDQGAAGAMDRILIVLRGQEPTPKLQELASVPFDTYPFGISVIIPAKNEAENIGPCIQSLEGSADEVLVVSMDCSDDTDSIAREHGATIIPHPQIPGWDRARMSAVSRARFKFTLAIDADERLPAGFGAELRKLLAEQGHRFEALQLPFATYFANKRMASISPYKAPSVFKTGYFFYNSRPHQGARVDGRIAKLPSHDPDRALPHFSYSSFGHHVAKMNGYSSKQAQDMDQDGQKFHWKDMAVNAVQDICRNYDANGGRRDGVHGLYWALLSGIYRIVQHGKLYEAHYNADILTPAEQETPVRVEEFLEFALGVARAESQALAQRIRNEENQKNASATVPPLVNRDSPHLTSPKRSLGLAGRGTSTLSALLSSEETQELDKSFRTPGILSAPKRSEDRADRGTEHLTPDLIPNTQYPIPDSQRHLPRFSTEPYPPLVPPYSVVFRGPFLSPSGYGEESRHNLLALDEAGVSVVAKVAPWKSVGLHLGPEEGKRLGMLAHREILTAGTSVELVEDFACNYRRDPDAKFSILRTMFETDRAPAEWMPYLCSADRIWVPSEFNRKTFSRSGIPIDIIGVIPGCIDPLPYLEGAGSTALAKEIRGAGKFTYLFVGEWCRRKGWHALLSAFLDVLAGNPNVALVIKTWSSIDGVGEARIRRMAGQYSRCVHDQDLPDESRIRFIVDKPMSREDMISLYKACDALVIPSFGEGSGRPYLEAMASGLPAIGTNYSGNTEFMTSENSYLVDYHLVPVPQEYYREAPAFKGHRWAQVDLNDLKQKMRRVVEERGESASIGKRAQEEICAKYSRAAVGKIMRQEIEQLLDR